MKNHNNNYSNQQFRQTCDLANTTQVDCNSTSLPGGNAFIPVVLGDVELQALVESEYTLPTPAREIKSVRRNVSLNQCRAIASSIPSRGFFSQVKVFVSGVIHKNIQYVEDCNGYVRDYSVEVPFSCNQSLFVRRAPQGNFSLNLMQPMSEFSLTVMDMVEIIINQAAQVMNFTMNPLSVSYYLVL